MLPLSNRRSMHSGPFIEVRDAILALSDADRTRLAALLGCMHDARPPLSGALAAVLARVAALDPVERRRLGSWCAAYLSRWGQVPAAASRRVVPPERKPI